MGIAKAVEEGANCLGSHVGAVVVFDDRVLGAGYNGTPSRFTNCDDHGCVRCTDSWLHKQGRESEMKDKSHTSGAALDRCICVHAEQNAFLAAARYGVRLDGATLYTTQSPCLGCLKEAVQAGISRVVYGTFYAAKYSPDIQKQYDDLAHHLSEGDPTRFEAVGGGPVRTAEEGQPDAYASASAETLLTPPYTNGNGTEPE